MNLPTLALSLLPLPLVLTPPIACLWLSGGAS
jgi:hypothetical protein